MLKSFYYIFLKAIFANFRQFLPFIIHSIAWLHERTASFEKTQLSLQFAEIGKFINIATITLPSIFVDRQFYYLIEKARVQRNSAFGKPTVTSPGPEWGHCIKQFVSNLIKLFYINVLRWTFLTVLNEIKQFAKE